MQGRKTAVLCKAWWDGAVWVSVALLGLNLAPSGGWGAGYPTAWSSMKHRCAYCSLDLNFVTEFPWLPYSMLMNSVHLSSWKAAHGRGSAGVIRCSSSIRRISLVMFPIRYVTRWSTTVRIKLGTDQADVTCKDGLCGAELNIFVKTFMVASHW